MDVADTSGDEPLRAANETPGTRPNADRPVDRATDDLLDRTTLVEQLTAQALSAPRDEGFVIGLSGAWGTGKTSVLNFVTERLETEDVLVLRFDPWLFTGASDLLTRFFGELAAQLGKTSALKELGGDLRRLGKALAPAASVVAGPAGQLLAAPAQLADSQSKSAMEERGRIREKLAKQGRRIVVVIDDVDRLQAEEIRELVRLIKLVADLPGVVYLMAFERRRVELALAGTNSDDGREYLEKIIQAPFALQPPRRSRVVDLAFRWLDDAIDAEKTAWNEGEWASLVHDGIENYIATLRDARRLANVVPAAIRLTTGEVAAMDVIALEVIRLFDPDVHEALPRLAPILTASRKFELRSSEQLRVVDQADVDDALNQSSNREAATHLLGLLFPAAGHLFGRSRYGSNERAWQAAKRVASRRILDRYLHASLAEGEAPAYLVAKFVDALADPERLQAMIDEMPEPALGDVLDRARNELSSEALPNPAKTALVLVRLADASPLEKLPLLVDNRRRAIWLLEEIVARIPEPARRQEVVLELLNGAPTLTARHNLLYSFGSPGEEPSGNPRTDVLSRQQTREAHEQLAATIVAADPAEIAHRETLSLLREVVEHHPDGRNTVIGMLENEELAAAALTQSLTIVVSAAGHQYKLQANGLLVELLGRDGIRDLAERVRDAGFDDEGLAIAVDAAANEQYTG